MSDNMTDKLRDEDSDQGINDEFNGDYIPMYQFVSDSMLLSLYFMSLDKPIQVYDKDVVKFDKEHNLNVCNQVNNFLCSLCRNSLYRFSFGYGFVYTKNPNLKLSVFPSFCLFGQYIGDDLFEMSWDKPEFAIPLFIGRSLDCQILLFSDIPSKRHESKPCFVSLAYGPCSSNDYKVFDFGKEFSYRFGRSCGSYLFPLVNRDDSNIDSMYLICMIVDDRNISEYMQDRLHINDLLPNVLVWEFFPYGFSKRSSIDKTLYEYGHMDKDKDIIRAPSGGAIAASRFYKGGQYLPGIERGNNEQ